MSNSRFWKCSGRALPKPVNSLAFYSRPSTREPRRMVVLPLGSIVCVCCSLGGESLRDVIAFPKTQRASDLMLGAPSAVEPQQLRDLQLRLA